MQSAKKLRFSRAFIFERSLQDLANLKNWLNIGIIRNIANDLFRIWFERILVGRNLVKVINPSSKLVNYFNQKIIETAYDFNHF